jgi:DNA repair protein RadC
MWREKVKSKTWNQESFFVVIMDYQQRPLEIIEMFRGGLSSSIVDMKTIFYNYFKHQGAGSLAVGHNHPSGNLTASVTDIKLTERIAECCKLLEINFLDHVIFSETGFISLRTETSIWG